MIDFNKSKLNNSGDNPSIRNVITWISLGAIFATISVLVYPTREAENNSTPSTVSQQSESNQITLNQKEFDAE